MTLTWLPGHRSRSRFARGASLVHAECPLEQALRSDDADVQARLLREAWSPQPGDGVLLVASAAGLRLLGESESVLELAVASLRKRFQHRLVVEPPKVRLAFGNPTLEPWMTVVVTASPNHLHDIRADFVRRCGSSPDVRDADPCVLEGEGPLRRLLGYARGLAAIAPGSRASVALSRYLPVDDGGPAAA